jgi:hypothetical protein
VKKKLFSQSAFFNPRAVAGLFLCLTGVSLAFFAFAQNPGEQKQPQRISFQSVASYHNDVSLPLRDLARLPIRASSEYESNFNPKIPFHHADAPDPQSAIATHLIRTVQLAGPSHRSAKYPAPGRSDSDVSVEARPPRAFRFDPL